MDKYLYPDSRILVFAKAPIPGKVKTRMQPELSKAQSLSLHRQMTHHCLQQVCDSGLAPVTLWVSEQHNFWEELAQNFSFDLEVQTEGNLGERMAYAAEKSLSFCHSVLIVGTDCPFIDEAYLTTALNKLLEGDSLVLGPAFDGGYVLIGLRQFHSGLFKNIAWGGDQVFSDTCMKASNLGLKYSILARLHDIDRPTDIHHIEDFVELHN